MPGSRGSGREQRELRDINRLLESASALDGLAGPGAAGAAALRRRIADGTNVRPASAPLDHAHWMSIEGRHGSIGLRVLRPPVVRGVYLHLHRGGWVLGGADHQDPELWALAQAASVAVVSVEYRLAPEHPFPAGPDDCEDAAIWLIQNAQLEFDTDRLVMGGEGAGANLAATTLVRLRDRHGLERAFCGANLSFGMYDLSQTPSLRHWGQRDLVLSLALVQWFGDQYLPHVPIEWRSDPDLSPLYADLRNLCPARFLVGTCDPLLDDTLFMEARWRSAGNATELELVTDGAHDFTSFASAATDRVLAAAHAFVRRAITPDAASHPPPACATHASNRPQDRSCRKRP